MKSFKILDEEVASIVHSGGPDGPLRISIESVWHPITPKHALKLIKWLKDAVDFIRQKEKGQITCKS